MIHVAACCICGSAPARLGDAGPGLRAAPVLRAAPAQRAACGCGDLAGVPPGESAGGHLGSCGVKTTNYFSAETVWCVCAGRPLSVQHVTAECSL